MNSFKPKIENKWVKINNNLSKKMYYMYIPSILYVLVTVYIHSGKLLSIEFFFKRYMIIQKPTIDIYKSYITETLITW